MAGFDEDRAHQVLHIPRDQYDILAAVAIGYAGDSDALPPDVRKMEAPNDRKPLADIAWEGVFKG